MKLTTLRLSLAPVLLVASIVALAPSSVAAQDPGPPPNPQVVIETSLGDITVELFRPQAPVSVVNFLTYVQAGFYEGTIFHRVIRGFMVQGGGFDENVEPRAEGLRGGILNEATNNLQNRRGTIAMARTAAPNSARAQFFINTVDNDALNHKNATDAGFGYAVFGEVVEGMDVVDQIERVRTHTVNGMRDVPRDNVVIHTIRRVEAPAQ